MSEILSFTGTLQCPRGEIRRRGEEFIWVPEERWRIDFLRACEK